MRSDFIWKKYSSSRSNVNTYQVADNNKYIFVADFRKTWISHLINHRELFLASYSFRPWENYHAVSLFFFFTFSNLVYHTHFNVIIVI